MNALVTLTWLCACSLQWTVEATYNDVYFQPPPLFSKIRLPEPFCPPDPKIPYAVTAYFDMNGIRGNITFSQRRRSAPVIVSVMLDGLNQFDEDERWGWHVHDCPINFAQLEEFPCSTASVGGHFDPDDRGSNANYSIDCSPDTPEECELGDLSGRFGRLLPGQSVYQFKYRERGFHLYGPQTFVGRSIVIHRTDGFRWACANIEYDGHNRLNTFVARFPQNPKQQENTLQGDVVLRRSTKRAGVSVFGVLYRVNDGPVEASHNWNLREGTCDSLSDEVYGFTLPYHFRQCSTTNHRLCRIGDLTSKCGPLQSDADGRIKFFCTDAQLGLLPYNLDDDYPTLSLVIEEAGSNDVLACSNFEAIAPKVARASFGKREWIQEADGRYTKVYQRVDFYVYQSDPHDPTYIRIYTTGLQEPTEQGEVPYLQIRERPVGADKNCSNLGPVFEPRPYLDESLPEIEGVIQTGERDFIGELRNKIPLMDFPPRTSWLPLFGGKTIIGRSLVLHDGEGNVLDCGTIEEVAPLLDLRSTLGGYYK